MEQHVRIRYKDKEGRRNDNFQNVIMSQELFTKILGSYAKNYDQQAANRDTNRPKNLNGPKPTKKTNNIVMYRYNFTNAM